MTREEDEHSAAVLAQLKALKIKRSRAKAACTRSNTFADELGDRVVSVFELKQRQAKFRECWQQFDDAQAGIELIQVSEEEIAANGVERAEFEDKYFAIEAKLEELIIARTPGVNGDGNGGGNGDGIGHAADFANNARGPNPFQPPAPPIGNIAGQQPIGNIAGLPPIGGNAAQLPHRDNVGQLPNVNNAAQQPNLNMRLPRIELPTFSGAYEEWRPFRDIFQSMIHDNVGIPVIQKLHYLKGSLKGEPADVISSLSSVAENYEEAWALLIDRYDVQRVIVSQHIKALFDYPVLHKENHTDLRRLLDTFLKHLRALKVLERPTAQWDDLIIHLITRKIAPVTNKEWETSLKDATIPNLKQLTDFLTHHCRTLEAVDKRPQASASGSEKTHAKRSIAGSVVTSRAACSYCKGDHAIFHCSKFLELSIDRRFQEARTLKLCINCLKTTEHRAKQCNGGSCKICHKKHNTLLHMDSSQHPSSRDSQDNESSPSSATPRVSTIHAAVAAGRQVLLSTAIVQVRDLKGNLCSCRALLDCGAQSNFITADLANKLGHPQRPTCIPISGVGDSRTETRRIMRVTMQSRLNAFKEDLDCLILHKITQDIPVVSLERSEIRIPAGIKLADPNFLQSSQIDMLIGVSAFWNLMCVGQIKATETQPCWQKTHLGWIAAGGIVASQQQMGATICNVSMNSELTDALTRFWEIEQGARRSSLSVDERKCEAYYDATVRRNNEGRFIVKLPVKEEISRLGQSKETAIRRFRSLEKRLSREPTLKRDYTDFLKEYESLGHMRELQSCNASAWPHYYMPHHCVIKRDNTTTKLRVVFDASCKTSSNLSLNEALMVGPTLQQDLFSIIARFRTHKYVLVADIAKMYRQVLVDETQVPLQRIVWRDNPEGQIKEFEMLTVTYGTASAAFLAVKSLRTLAELEAKEFPAGSLITLRDFYVDDLITGADSRENALRIRDEVKGLLAKGGFELRKWASNSPDLLASIPVDSTTSSVLSLDKEGTFKTLGIQWSPSKDAFRYSISIDDSKSTRTTKRTILSCIAQIFDPLGLLGPIIILAKILIQRLWTLRLDWDEALTTELHTEWQMYKAQLMQLKQLQIPRAVVGSGAIKRLEMHGFCDASQNAYGACMYIRSTDQHGSSYTYLLCSKSRVAPLKTVSLPRLELCGALLLAQLVDKVIPILGLKIDAIYYWTDATIVLDWIQSPSRKFNTFVANRVGEIQELTCKDSWRHVGTEYNPADVLSRGTHPESFMQAQLWWSGPPWLSEDQASWPHSNRQTTNTDELPELRKVTIIASTSQEDEDPFQRFSSYTRLVKAIATCLRFAHNTRVKREERVLGPILTMEFENARKAVVKRVQKFTFAKEIEAIEAQRATPRNSHLLSLNPFLDTEGLLRVGGRLKNSNLPYDAKHPLLLPADHHLTRLVIKYNHEKCLHAGPQATLAALRLRYWPIGARKLVRSVVHKCVTCFKANPSPTRQLMGDLPSPRVTQSRPFSHAGVDYCGPMYIREGKRRNAKKTKAWVAIFVCLATKAIHIELVSDLTTEGFLNALKRFIGRRGKPSDIYSDNGTNFVGANRELEELRTFFNEEKVQNQIIHETCADAITWHFIPPRAPHFGGLWEAAVRSMKHHFNRVAADQSLTFEEAVTLLIEIEAILNSRPLTPLSPDPEDYSYLTPGHFLIGDSLISYPEPSLHHLPINRLSRWQRIEQIRQHFWSRWSGDYLHNLQQRTKWKKEEGPPLKPGQLVVVRDSEQPPRAWLLGRVVVTHPGSDGIVRAATIKTLKGLFKRPATKLCILPIET